MRRLDALLGRKASSPESRSSFSQWLNDSMMFGGGTYQGYTTTYGTSKAESITADFTGFISGGLKGNGSIFALERMRVAVFSEARFQWQAVRPGSASYLYGTPDLQLLERPWAGGTTGDLLSRMLLDADLAGNAYVVRNGSELVRLRPDWVDIVLGDRYDGDGRVIGQERAGYFYYEGGKPNCTTPAFYLPNEVAHFAPMPDPSAQYMGMSWLTPVIRVIQTDTQATKHKLKFFENAATPNLAVSLKEGLSPEQFREFVDLMDRSHKGVESAYKTLYTANGADVTVIGADMKQMDFGNLTAQQQTQLANAAGVPVTIVGFSEGLAGSSLNAGNYQAAKRNFADSCLRNLWRNVSGSLEVLFPAPAGSRLWYDDRDVAFLRDDEKDTAEIMSLQALALRTLLDAGVDFDSAAPLFPALPGLTHSGLFSVQLQPPGTVEPPGDVPDEPPARSAGDIHVHVDARQDPAQVTIQEGAVQVTNRHEIDASTHIADGAVPVNVEVDARTTVEPASVEIRQVPAAPTRKTVETDDRGRITAINEEPA